MPFTVQYSHSFNYQEFGDKSFPVLQIGVSSPLHPESGSIDIDGYLDSGAEYSLLNGWIAKSLGFDLYNGSVRQYNTTAGNTIEGRVHRVRLSHPDLGSFELEMGFSNERISRNLLGRDFFDLIQIGFRQRHRVYYLTPTP